MAIVPRKKKDGISYQVKVKDRFGNWYPTPTYSDLAEAKAEEARLFALNRKGACALSEDAKQNTVQDYWDVWSVENRSKVSAGWKISQDQMWRDFVQPVLGHMKMAKVDKPAIGRVLKRMQDDDYSDQTRKHVYSLLRSMFGDAVEYYEMLASSPVSARFHRPKVAKAKRKFLAPAAAMRLCEAAKSNYMGPPTNLGILSALRISEIQALRGRCLLWDQNMILVCAAFNNKTGVMQDYPKQENWAYVPMPPLLKEYLLSLEVGPDDFVAPGPKGNMLPYETYNRALRRLCRSIGVDELTTHELRHSSTEVWVQAGASAEDIRRLLNHSSLSVTSTYMHRTDDRLNEIGKHVGKLRSIEGGLSFPKSFPLGNKEAGCRSDFGIRKEG